MNVRFDNKNCWLLSVILHFFYPTMNVGLRRMNNFVLSLGFGSPKDVTDTKHFYPVFSGETLRRRQRCDGPRRPPAHSMLTPHHH